MAIDERSRKSLYDKLEATLGSDSADTVMELLPPVGWADVATKQDLELQKQQIVNTITWRLVVLGTILPFVA
jgi:hypothetical protein